MTDDFLEQWARLIDDWADAAASASIFRWSYTVDSEVAEFLLHGFERCLHSSTVQDRITEKELLTHRVFTLHIIQAFVDGMAAEGQVHEHYVDQIRAEFGGSVDL